MTKTTDVAVSGEEISLGELFAALAGDALAPVTQTAEEAQHAIAKRYLEAETVDEVLGTRTALHARDVLDVPIELRNVRFLRSAFDSEAGPGVFAVLDITIVETGEATAVTCGSVNVMAQAAKLRDLEALPVTVKIVESDRQTEAGFRPMWLEAA